MKTLLHLFTFLVVCALPVLAAPPVVSNVRAAQIPGTKNIEVLYDVSDADGDLLTIAMQVSGDAGQTYTIPATALSGHIGAGVASGANRRIIWNAGADWNGQLVSNGKVRVTASDGTNPAPPPGMALIPSGSFQMGDNFNEIGSDTLPIHNVQVSAFFIDRFEVKKELWEAVATWASGRGYGFGLHVLPKGNGYPIHGLNWFSAVMWCNARSEKEGLVPVYYTDSAQLQVYRTGAITIDNSWVKWGANGYRLPTEAEWERAARGGIHGSRFPWGDSIDGSKANFSASGDPFDAVDPGVTVVGYYNGSQTPNGIDMANGYGLYDMAGNVEEWCWDWYSSTYYGTSGSTDPVGPTSGTSRITRGGSWLFGSTTLRVASRSSSNPSNSPYSPSYRTGFRTVRKAQ